MNAQSKIMSTQEVLALTGVSHATLYASLLKKLDFPRPFKIGIRKNAWFRVDVEAWIAARAAMATSFGGVAA